MNCYTHGTRPAVGICAICQKAICHNCVGRDAPRLACRECVELSPVVLGFEYKSPVTIGIDPVTMRPTAAKGVIAIGNIAFGGLAIGGLAVGLISIGGLSVGLACALGGAALGLGLSVGGFALGSVAIGGVAVGFAYALGGAAFGPAVIDGRHCDEAARDLIIRWFGTRWLPPSCPADPFRLIQ